MSKCLVYVGVEGSGLRKDRCTHCGESVSSHLERLWEELEATEGEVVFLSRELSVINPAPEEEYEGDIMTVDDALELTVDEMAEDFISSHVRRVDKLWDSYATFRGPHSEVPILDDIVNESPSRVRFKE